MNPPAVITTIVRCPSLIEINEEHFVRMLLFAKLAMSIPNDTAPQRLLRVGAAGLDKEVADNVQALIKRAGGAQLDIRKMKTLTVEDIDTMLLMLDLNYLESGCPAKFRRKLKAARESLMKGVNPFSGAAVPVTNGAGVEMDQQRGNMQAVKQVQQAVNEDETRAELILNEIDKEVLRVIVELYNRNPPAFRIIDTSRGPGRRLYEMIRTFA